MTIPMDEELRKWIDHDVSIDVEGIKLREGAPPHVVKMFEERQEKIKKLREEGWMV